METVEANVALRVGIDRLLAALRGKRTLDIFIRCLITGGKVGVEAGQADHGPHRTETDYRYYHTERSLFDNVKELILIFKQQNYMCRCTGKYEYC